MIGDIKDGLDKEGQKSGGRRRERGKIKGGAFFS